MPKKPTGSLRRAEEHGSRVTAENACQPTELLYRSVVEHANDAFLMHTFEGTIVDGNENACRMFGRPRQGLIGASLSLIESPLHSRLRPQRMQELREKGALIFEADGYAPDGTWRAISISATVLSRHGEGLVASFIREVTESRLQEAELRKRESDFSSLVENSTDFIVRFDQQFRYLYCNPTVQRVFGVQPHIFLGKQPSAVPQLRDHSDFIEAILRQVLSSGEEAQFVQTWNTAEGCRHIHTRVVPERNQGGIVSLLAIGRDITDYQRTEDALREKSEELDRYFSGSLDLFCIFDHNGVLRRLNPAWEKALGYPLSELLGRALLELIHPDDREATRQALACLHDQQEVSGFVNRFRCRNDEWRWLEWHGFANEHKLFGIARDITRRRQTEENLRRLAAAIEQAGECIVITDPQGQVEYVNPAFERITGYSSQEILGRNPRLLKSGRQDVAFYQHLWQTITAGRTWSGRLVNKKKNGHFYTEDCTISPVFGEHGRIERFVAVKKDVTAQLKLEEDLRQAQKMESVGRLAAGVAHDLNNLFTPILGYTEMLLGQLHASDLRHEQALAIRHAAERAFDLTRQLLAFGRKQTLQIKPVDLNLVLSGMEKLIRRVLRENIKLQVILPSSPCPVLADVGQVEQVMMNLVLNAQDAMADGGRLTLQVLCADEAEPNGRRYGTIIVSDTGCGMDHETQSRIFEPFFSTKGQQGMGLGLASTYGIISQHEGILSVQSAPGAGSTFTICLPWAEGVKEVAVPPLPELPLVPPPRSHQGATVLVVEDEEVLLQFAGSVLRQCGYTVLLASDGVAAETLSRRHAGNIDLLLTDVVLPGPSGPATADRLLARRPEMKILFMSGYPQDVWLRQPPDQTPLPVLRKPFSPSELAHKVRETLEEGRCATDQTV